MNPRIEELLITASDSGDPVVLDSLLAEFHKVDPAAKEVRDGVAMMIETWGGVFEPRRKAELLFELAAFYNEDFPTLRSALPKALRALLPPDMESASIVNVLGLRDERTPLPLVHARIRKFWHLAAGNYFFQDASSQWGKIESVDSMSDVVRLAFINSSRRQEAGMATVLDTLMLFRNEGKFKSLFQELSASKARPPSSDVCREVFTTYVCGAPPLEAIKKSLALLLVPAAMTLPAFDKWWEHTEKNGPAPAKSRSEFTVADARSLQELNILLKDESKLHPKDPDSITRVAKVMNLLRADSLPKDYVTWAENLCLLSKGLDGMQLGSLVAGCSHSFDLAIPVDPAKATPLQLKIWETLKTSTLPTWTKCVAAGRGTEFMPRLALKLPWRAWSPIIALAGPEAMTALLGTLTRPTKPEVLLWIWENKHNVSKALAAKLNFAAVLKAMSEERNGSAWIAGQKELRRLFMDDPEFHRHIVEEDSESYFRNCLETLGHAGGLSSSERQSLVVKISRQFPNMRRALEAGGARSVMKAKADEAEQKAANKPFEQLVTSAKSYQRRASELKDLISRQLPENAAALAHARSLGDLRENSEFSAAKERQKYLNARQAELESDLLAVRTSDFSDIVIGDRVVVGCTVTLAFADGKKEVYHVLGAWDSDPDKKYVSYQTTLGKALIAKKTGEAVVLPDGRNCSIGAIQPLSADMKKDLSGE